MTYNDIERSEEPMFRSSKPTGPGHIVTIKEIRAFEEAAAVARFNDQATYPRSVLNFYDELAKRLLNCR